MKLKRKPHTVIYITEFDGIKERYEISIKPLDRIPEIEIVEDELGAALYYALDNLIVFFAVEASMRRSRGKPFSLVIKKMLTDYRVVHRVSVFDSFEMLLTSNDSSVRQLMSILYPIITRLKDANDLNKSSRNVRGTSQLSECSEGSEGPVRFT